MAQPIIEEIDISSITWRNRTAVSVAQSEAILNIRVGQSFALTHEGYKSSQCGQRNNGAYCALRNRLINVGRVKRPEVTIAFKHLPDGRLGVACFAKDS